MLRVLTIGTQIDLILLPCSLRHIHFLPQHLYPCVAPSMQHNGWPLLPFLCNTRTTHVLAPSKTRPAPHPHTSAAETPHPCNTITFIHNPDIPFHPTFLQYSATQPPHPYSSQVIHATLISLPHPYLSFVIHATHPHFRNTQMLPPNTRPYHSTTSTFHSRNTPDIVQTFLPPVSQPLRNTSPLPAPPPPPTPLTRNTPHHPRATHPAHRGCKRCSPCC